MKQKISISIIFFLVIMISGFLVPFQSEAMIYVSNFNNGTVTVFPSNANNDMAPTNTISYSGVPTPPVLVSPAGIAVDANWIYVVDDSTDSILVFPIDVTGDVEPTRRIRGAATTLQNLAGIAVDANWIYVTDTSSPPRVMVFPITADDNVAPDHTISGTNTTFQSPYAIAVDANWIYVADVTVNSRIDVFPINGFGNIAPTRFLTVASGVALPTAIAVDTNYMYVMNYFNDRITVYPIGATDPDSYIREISGISTGINNSEGIAVDANWIYVANGTGSNSVTVYPLDGNGNIAPTRTISGGLTTLNRPFGIAVRSDPASAISVPAMTEWGIIIFVVIAGLGANYFMRRQRAAQS